MKIKSEKKVWMPNPELNWSAGEIKKVSEKVGTKLLINKNFSMISEAKPEVRQKYKSQL